MVENKVKGARFSPEMQEKIAAYESVFGWDFGQVVTQLLQHRDRVNHVLSRVEIVRTDQGGEMLFFEGGPDSDTPFAPVNIEALCFWLVRQLQMSVAEGFRDSFFGLDPWEE